MRRVLAGRDDEAVASSIGTMLAILVVLALITMVTTTWAPEWTKDKESEHLRVVESQFMSLKALMDQLSLSGSTDMVVSTPITLGAEGVPLFGADSSGKISLLSSQSERYNTFGIRNSTGRFQRVAYGSIMYESRNTQYIDQSYIYESGSVIVSQEDGELMTTGPSLIVQNVSGQVQISATLISIYSDGGSYTGAGTIGIQCRMVKEKITSTVSWPSLETIELNVTSSAYMAWYEHLNRIVPEAGVGSGDFDVSVDDPTSSVRVTLRNVSTCTVDYVILGANLDLS